MRRFLVVADERRHLVTTSNQRVEHRRTDVAGSSGQKDPHAKCYSLLRTNFGMRARSCVGQREWRRDVACRRAPRKALKPR